MKLSVVTTLYYSEKNLPVFYRRMRETVAAITDDYQLIYVNDGSPDQSLQVAIEQLQHDRHIKIVDLARNFGHHQAGMVGLQHAEGEYVFFLDSDLEEAPETLQLFWEKIQEQPDLDVVYGVQKQRKGSSWFGRQGGKLFYRLFNAISSVKIPENMMTVRLMTKQFVDAVLTYQEHQLFLGGLMVHAGFRQLAVELEKIPTPHSTYTWRKQIRLLLTAVTSFSSKPLEWILILGLSLCIVSVLALFGLIVNQIWISALFLPDTHMLLIAISLFSGIIVSAIGIVGVYMAKIHEEVKRRPRAIVKAVYDLPLVRE